MTVLLLLLLMTTPSGCGLCHPRERHLYDDSIHARRRLGCVACHGGQEKAGTTKEAHRHSRGRIGRRQIPRLCARCHSDPRRMRPFNLPIDQYALYRTSRHGLLLSQGDTRVAVCTDCHGTHDIRPPEEEESRVFVRNIPRTCGHCHSDPTLMRRYGLSWRIEKEYLGSVHGRALMEKGTSAAPECSRCHGIHGAAPPGIGDISTVCGNCHPRELEAFERGPHARAMRQARIPACVACHDHHRIDVYSSTRLSAACIRCHAADSSPYAVGKRMETLLENAERRRQEVLEEVRQAARVPLPVEDYQARLETAGHKLAAVGPAVHSLALEGVELLTRAARSQSDSVEAEIQGKLQRLETRKYGLVLFWFYLLLALWVIERRRRLRSGA